MLNRWVGVGKIGKDGIELRYSPGGKPVCSFKLGIQRPFKNQQGQREWDNIPVVHWGQGAEFAANSGQPGDWAAVEGAIQIRSFEGQDGQKRWVTEINADRVRILKPKYISPGDMGEEVQLTDEDAPF